MASADSIAEFQKDQRWIFSILLEQSLSITDFTGGLEFINDSHRLRGAPNRRDTSSTIGLLHLTVPPSKHQVSSSKRCSGNWLEEVHV
jgi:hypothetical protein